MSKRYIWKVDQTDIFKDTREHTDDAGIYSEYKPWLWWSYHCICSSLSIMFEPNERAAVKQIPGQIQSEEGLQILWASGGTLETVVIRVQSSHANEYQRMIPANCSKEWLTAASKTQMAKVANSRLNQLWIMSQSISLEVHADARAEFHSDNNQNLLWLRKRLTGQWRHQNLYGFYFYKDIKKASELTIPMRMLYVTPDVCYTWCIVFHLKHVTCSMLHLCASWRPEQIVYNLLWSKQQQSHEHTHSWSEDIGSIRLHYSQTHTHRKQIRCLMGPHATVKTTIAMATVVTFLPTDPRVSTKTMAVYMIAWLNNWFYVLYTSNTM